MLRRFLMFSEYYNGGMIEIESRDDEFLEDEFSSMREMKKDLNLHESSEHIDLVLVMNNFHYL